MPKEDGVPEPTQELQDVPKDDIQTALIKVNVTNQVLARLKAEAEAFVINGPDDKEGYEKVRRHRLDIVPLRTATVSAMKGVREEALAFQRRVKTEEDRVVGELQAAEAIDAAKEAKYLADRQAIEDKKVADEKARVDGLLDQLKKFEWNGNPLEVAQDTPERFSERLKKAESDFTIMEAGRKAEADRKAREEQEARDLAKKNRLESERLDAQRREQEAEQAKIDAQKLELEATQRRIKEDEDAKEKKRLEDELAAKKAELDRIAQEEQQKRDQAEKDRLAKEASDRAASLAPDKEKISKWITAIEAFLHAPPEIKDPELLREVKHLTATITNGINLTKQVLK